jgi:hypothetical protein
MAIQTDLLGLCGVNVGVNHRGQLLLKRMRGPRTKWGEGAKNKECVVLFVEGKFVNNVLGLQ